MKMNTFYTFFVLHVNYFLLRTLFTIIITLQGMQKVYTMITIPNLHHKDIYTCTCTRNDGNDIGSHKVKVQFVICYAST